MTRKVIEDIYRQCVTSAAAPPPPAAPACYCSFCCVLAHATAATCARPHPAVRTRAPGDASAASGPQRSAGRCNAGIRHGGSPSARQTSGSSPARMGCA
eukprot:scaffold18606_cov60-Phaeocystis_antarctica.AAC.7